MTYLFFDIECANNRDKLGKICEFGYVLTDENLREIESEQLLINPESSFESYVIKNILSYKKSDYLSAPPYAEFYPKISKLLTEADMVFGHSVDNDARYVADESVRNSLPFIDFDFYDLKELYDECTGEGEIGLDKMSDALGVEKQNNVHRALDDALVTMRCAKRLSEDMGKSLCELCDEYECKGTLRGSVVTVFRREKIRRQKMEALIASSGGKNNMKGVANELYKMFVSRLAVTPNPNFPFNGKKIVIGSDYTRDKFRETLAFTAALAANGVTVVDSVRESDALVYYGKRDEQGKRRFCPQMGEARERMAADAEYILIKMYKVLAHLGMDEKELSSVPFPPRSAFFD